MFGLYVVLYSRLDDQTHLYLSNQQAGMCQNAHVEAVDKMLTEFSAAFKEFDMIHFLSSASQRSFIFCILVISPYLASNW